MNLKYWQILYGVKRGLLGLVIHPCGKKTPKQHEQQMAIYIPSWELTYPLPVGTFESMIFLFPFGGIWHCSLEGILLVLLLLLMAEIWKTTWDVLNPIINGINYQPQLVSRISSINSRTGILLWLVKKTVGLMFRPLHSLLMWCLVWNPWWPLQPWSTSVTFEFTQSWHELHLFTYN